MTMLPVPGRVREITSFSNPAIKDIRALALKKYRDRTQTFLAEGLKLTVDALDRGWKVRSMILSTSARGQPAIEQASARTRAQGGDVLIVPEKVLGAITRRDNPQQVVSIFEQRHPGLDSLRPDGEAVFIALDRVRDPGNLGTIIRTADAVGAGGIILVGDCTDPYGMEAVRATMGSLFTVPVIRSGEAEFLAWRSRFAGLVVGTHLAGAADYRSLDYAGRPVLLVMGNEQQGLSERMAAACDSLVRIPQAGSADSLNLAVATAVMLYEIRRHALKLDPS